MVTPAEGPSLGMAPAGTWMWMSFFSKRRGGDVEGGRARTGVGERGLRGLLHHLAELAGQDQTAAPGNSRGLDEEHVAAAHSGSEAGGDADLVGFSGQLPAEARRAEVVVEVAGIDGDRVDIAAGDASGDAAANAAQLAFEVANAGFAGVGADDLCDGALGDAKGAVRDSVLAGVAWVGDSGARSPSSRVRCSRGAR